MKLFKIVDCVVQMILIDSWAISVIRSLTMNEHEMWPFYFYFIVGGWQLFSVAVHTLLATPEKDYWMRRVYLRTLMIVAILALLLCFIILVYGMGLLFFSPLMAVWYLITCIIETVRYDQMYSQTNQPL